MKKQKGFTLIELLAIIVILAIIAVITVPIILNVIDNAKKGTAKDSAYGYKDAISKYYVSGMLENESIQLNGNYNVVDGKLGDYEIPFSGTKPTSGYLTFENNILKNGCLTIDEYKVSFENGEVNNVAPGICENKATPETPDEPETPTTYTVYADGTAVYYNPVSGEKCNESDAVSTTGTKTGCMKFYTFNDEGENASEVNMILDHNTTPFAAWNSSGKSADGMNEVKNALETDTAGWKQTARLITADEIAEITGAKDLLYWSSDKTFAAATPSIDTMETQIYWFFLDGAVGSDPAWVTQIAKTKGASKYAWLFDNTNGCTSYGCNIADDNKYEYGTSGSTNGIYGYWTSTPVVGHSFTAWYVNWSGRLNYNDVTAAHSRGVRPVIKISKSIISQD